MTHFKEQKAYTKPQEVSRNLKFITNNNNGRFFNLFLPPKNGDDSSDAADLAIFMRIARSELGGCANKLLQD